MNWEYGIQNESWDAAGVPALKIKPFSVELIKNTDPVCYHLTIPIEGKWLRLKNSLVIIFQTEYSERLSPSLIL